MKVNDMYILLLPDKYISNNQESLYTRLDNLFWTGQLTLKHSNDNTNFLMLHPMKGHKVCGNN